MKCNTAPKLHMLHVVTDMNPQQGGVCHSVRTIIRGLNELNVISEVVCVDDVEAEYLQNQHFKVNNLGVSRGPWFFHPGYIDWLVKNMSRFDVVIVHGLWLYPGYAVGKALKKLTSWSRSKTLATKIFVMPHGMLDPYFQSASGRRVKAVRNWLYWKLIESKMVNQCNGILFTSDAEQKLARLPFRPYHPLNEYVVGLGAEEPPDFNADMVSAFLDRCPGLGKRPYYLFLGRIHEKKGVALLIEAYRKLKRWAIKANLPCYDLVIAGPGMAEPYGQSMLKLVADDDDLVSSVFFPGMLLGGTKWGAFYGCDVFVLPSHQENFGYAVVEALGCSKPVLISNQVNIWQTIEVSGGGIVKDDTEEGTLQLLSAWLGMNDLAKDEMRIRAKACFADYFGTIESSRRLLRAVTS